MWSPMCVIGALDPEKDWVIILVCGLIECGARYRVELTMWPSAPQSSIVGVLRSIDELVNTISSGGCGGGLHLGGDLSLIENPAARLGWRNIACRRLLGHHR